MNTHLHLFGDPPECVRPRCGCVYKSICVSVFDCGRVDGLEGGELLHASTTHEHAPINGGGAHIQYCILWAPPFL